MSAWPRINTDPTKESKPLHVLVTGAAGQIGYNLTFLIGNGLMFGKNQSVILHLYDVMTDILAGVEMEVTDCCFPLVKGIISGNDPAVVFKDVEVAILIAGMPRKKGMERKELIGINTRIMKDQAEALKNYSSKDIRVIVVANPANTNALVVCRNAGINPKQITSLSRLDQNRAVAQVAEKFNVPVENVKNAFIWGNHSEKQFPDITHCEVLKDGKYIKVIDNVDKDWLETFTRTVQERGAKVIDLRRASSAASASKAIVDHMRDWLMGTDKSKIVCMGVYSEGELNIPKGIFFSMPVVCYEGEYHVVEDLELTEDFNNALEHSKIELLEERELELDYEEITAKSKICD